MTTLFTKLISVATVLILGFGTVLSVGTVMAADDQPFQIIPKAEDHFASHVVELQNDE
jgi:archaellum component FlaF (FlaF/FlaG flagellin family)